MSGCLICQRPDICSTTSLESIRTSTAGRRVELAGGAQTGDQAAVLGDVVGGDADELGGLGEHLAGRRVDDDRAVAGGPRVAPGPAVGLDDELPAAHRPDSGVRTRMRRQFSQRSDLVGGGGAHVVELGDVQLQAAALAAPLVELGGADAARTGRAACRRASAGRRGRRRRRPRAPWSAVSASASISLERGVAAGLGLARPWPARRVQPLGQLGDPLLGGLAALHDLKDDVLQVALALGERADLALEVLQVLGRGDRAGVEALLVAGGALAHLVDVLLGLGLLAGGVALLGLRGDQQVAQLGERRPSAARSRRARAACLRLWASCPQTDVEGLDVEKADLVGGRGVQFGAPGLLEEVRDGSGGGYGAGACSVHGSVTAAGHMGAQGPAVPVGDLVELGRGLLAPRPLGGPVRRVDQGGAAVLLGLGGRVVAQVGGEDRRPRPAARTSAKRLSPEPPQTATVRIARSGSPATRSPAAVAGSRAAARAANSRERQRVRQLADPAEAAAAGRVGRRRAPGGR